MPAGPSDCRRRDAADSDRGRAASARHARADGRGERRQSMRGFEDTYTDIVDYIVRITHRIWEDQDVGYIYDTYAPGCFVYDDSGAQLRRRAGRRGHDASIHAFPDTRSWADEVIWAGNDEQGFVTSHRYVTTGHHLGAWRWGPADRPQGQPVGHRQLRDPGERDLRGMGAVQHDARSFCSSASTSAGPPASTATSCSRRRRATDTSARCSGCDGGRQPEYYPAPSRAAASTSSTSSARCGTTCTTAAT